MVVLVPSQLLELGNITYAEIDAMAMKTTIDQVTEQLEVRLADVD